MSLPLENPDPLRRLMEVMKALRSEDGCPWNRAQTHHSLTPFLIEESYELVEAIESENSAAMKEELGDVLMQVIFHATIAEEAEAFNLEALCDALTEKMIARHPHVFGKAPPLKTPEEVRKAWYKGKLKHKDSALEGIPFGQPALQLAFQTGFRAAQTGFEWRDVGEILAKVGEELEEIKAELAQPRLSKKALADEVGDLLFAMVQLTRWLEIDAESALRGGVKKFTQRFTHMEKSLKTEGKDLNALSPEDWWKYWAKAKLGEKHK